MAGWAPAAPMPDSVLLGGAGRVISREGRYVLQMKRSL